MADPLWGQQMTNMWMLDPTMFDPTQKSNQFSLWNNKPYPVNPTYNTGPAGGPTNAMGQLIPSFQAWQAANPAGTTLNSTPAQPQAAAAPAMGPAMGNVPMSPQQAQGMGAPGLALSNAVGAPGVTPQTPYGVPGGTPAATWYAAGANPDQMAGLFGQMSSTIPGTNQANPNYAARMGQMMAGAAQPAAPASAQSGAGAAPDNWMAALNALANPGNPVTPGANVPMASGYQPAGGVNNAFLGQAGGLGNQNFLSALAAIQGRPQAGVSAAPAPAQKKRGTG